MVLGLALGGTACGGSGDDADDAGNGQVEQIAFATSGTAGDVGWGQAGLEAAGRLAARTGVRVELVEGVGADGTPVADELTRLADGRAELVIAHGRDFAEDAAAVAAATDVPQLVFDAPDAAEPGLVGDVEIASEEGAYLAGYVAARASHIRSVGIVFTGRSESWYRTAGGFIAGARKFTPRARIALRQADPPDDDEVAAGAVEAEEMIRGGTQMVLGLGGVANFSLLLMTDKHGRVPDDAMFVDVIRDKAVGGVSHLSGLGAIVWDFQPAFEAALSDLRRGTFGERPYRLDLANGGIAFTGTGRTPGDGYEAAMRLGEQIEQGEIEVPVTRTMAEVRELLRDGAQ